MTKSEKILASLSFTLLIVAIVAKGIIGTTDVGVFVVLSFTGILVWFILFVSAFFPADWRMTTKQKSKIKNLTEYQNKYRIIVIGFDAVMAIIFAILIIALG